MWAAQRSKRQDPLTFCPLTPAQAGGPAVTQRWVSAFAGTNGESCSALLTSLGLILRSGRSPRLEGWGGPMVRDAPAALLTMRAGRSCGVWVPGLAQVRSPGTTIALLVVPVLSAHPRESGGPTVTQRWVPAFAGTNGNAHILSKRLLTYIGLYVYLPSVLLIQGRHRRRAEDGAAVGDGAGDAALSAHRVGPETVRSMRRPRSGLVSRTPGGPAQPPAGTKTGCPQIKGLHAVELKERRGPLRTRTSKGVRSARKRGSGVRNRRELSAGRRLPPIARRKETPSSVSGGLADRSGASQAPRLPALCSPFSGARNCNSHYGVPGVDQRIRAMSHASVIPGRAQRARTRNPYAAAPETT